MARGFKSGGRVQGTPNNDHKALSEMLKDRYPLYHPVIALAEIGNNKKNSIAIRLQAHKEVAKYICPQLKAIQFTDEQDNHIIVTIARTQPEPHKDNQLQSEINKLGS